MIHYKIGCIEFRFDELRMVGTLMTDTDSFTSYNPVELFNRFMSEVEQRLRKDLQQKLSGTDFNIWTGELDIKDSC